MFDKLKSKPFKSVIEDTGSENNYNTIENKTEKINLEYVFDDYDDVLAKIISKVVETESLSSLNDFEYNYLYYIFLIQHERSPMARNDIQFISDQAKELLKSLKHLNPVNYDELYNEVNLDENQVKALSIKNILGDKSKALDIITKRPLILLYNPNNNFITSDNAVSMYNHSPYETESLQSRYLEIIFPLSSKLSISIVPDYISVQINSNNRFSSIKNAIETRKSLRLSSKEVLFYNSLQLIKSRRFVYSNTELLTIFKENPEYVLSQKQRTASASVGFKQFFPEITKNDHVTLKVNGYIYPYDIINYSNNDLKLFIEMKTRFSINLFDKVEIEQVCLYSNQHLVQMMRHVSLKIVTQNSDTSKIEFKSKFG